MEVVDDAAEAGDNRDPPASEVRSTQEFGVADKKGQRHMIQRQRTISTSFGQGSADAYLAMVASALSQKMEEISALSAGVASGGDGADSANAGVTVPLPASTGDGDDCALDGGVSPKGDASLTAGEVVGVISYTEELRKNVVRSGVPPPLPNYTRVAMWRGEDVCLEQLGAGDMKELKVGITWCEPKGSSDTVDLDLSVMVRFQRTRVSAARMYSDCCAPR